MHKVKHLESAEVGEQIGNKVLGESVVRNIVPFVGIVSSAVTNFILTQRLGNTVRRYMRYQRAMETAFDRAVRECDTHLDLLVEGVWFIFTADGNLAPEETVTLVKLLEKLDPLTSHATLARFVEDELDWAERIEQVPEQMRDAFLYALEVAACVDKEVTLPERKILRRAAHHLGREFDLARLKAMVDEFEEEGVLAKAGGWLRRSIPRARALKHLLAHGPGTAGSRRTSAPARVRRPAVRVRPGREQRHSRRCGRGAQE